MHDLAILGAGPAGISAAIYALRAKLDVVVFEQVGVGGQIALSDIIENYPGFPSLSGMELMKHMEDHAKGLGAVFKFSNIEKIEKIQHTFQLNSADGAIEAKSVIVATGAKPRPLGIPGETEFTGRGVSTCATCDGPFYRGLDIAVIGGGDTAVKESIYLSKLCKKVHVVHRRDRFRAEKVLQERITAKENIQYHWRSVATEVVGDKSGVTHLKTKNLDSGATEDIPVSGVFVFVGITPSTGMVDCDKDSQGFIKTNERLETSIHGLFAAGDCRTTPLRQVATAVGDGAIAAVMAEEYISEQEGTAYKSTKSS